MAIRVLFTAREGLWPRYADVIPAAGRDLGLDIDLGRDHPPEEVDYLVCAVGGPVRDFSVFPRAKAALSLWAGVERLVANPTLTMPLARMVDPALTGQMVQWVLAHVLRYHIGSDAHVVNPGRRWEPVVPPLTSERRVGVLGLGELGAAVARALAGVGFAVAGWSRRPKTVPGITCHAGEEGLAGVLGRSEILVTLLPDTPGTEKVLNARTLALLPRGARVINPGRGTLIDDAALLAALDSGHLAHATLDVFRREPLPPGDPYWTHPKVTVTPHIAAETRPGTAAKVIAENIRRGEAGEPLLYLVDRAAGY